jgi:spore germination protein GerM
VDKNKKNIDYWDKYYGSGKDKKDPYPDYDKKYNPKTIKENTPIRKSGRKNSEPEGKIIGSEYKVRPPRKKKRTSPVVRFVAVILVLFLVGFFIFYAIDNHMFSKEKITENTKSASNAGNSSSENTSASNSKENVSTTGVSETDTQSSDTSLQGSTTGSTVDSTGSLQNTTGNSNQSLWQALIMFFKNFGKNKPEAKNYPEKLNLNVYFAIIGNEEIFGSEERTIVAGSPKVAAINALNELIKGPYEDFNFAVIPAGTKLLGIEVANKIAKINFSQEFLSESLDSSILDDYIIYTIVNTLTEIPDIEAVSFSIDDKDIKEYGNVDLRLPAIRNEKYLEITAK